MSVPQRNWRDKPFLKSIIKELINVILTPRHRRSSCCTGRRRRANSLGLSSSALLLLSASSSLCPLFTLCCSSFVALSKRKALCMLTAGCCKSQVHFENTEQYDDHHDKWGDAINMLEHHCYDVFLAVSEATGWMRYKFARETWLVCSTWEVRL